MQPVMSPNDPGDERVVTSLTKKADVARHLTGVWPRRLTLQRAPRHVPGCPSSSRPTTPIENGARMPRYQDHNDAAAESNELGSLGAK